MINSKNYKVGFTIDEIEICDFESMRAISNEEILKMSRGEENKRLLNFVSKRVKINKSTVVQPIKFVYFISTNQIRLFLHSKIQVHHPNPVIPVPDTAAATHVAVQLKLMQGFTARGSR